MENMRQHVCSLYDKWCFILLPEGTSVHAGRDVALTPTKNDQNHHSIRCRNKMRLDAYKGALDNLARNAIVKAVELGKSSLYFSA
jgi:hypothetical protein